MEANELRIGNVVYYISTKKELLTHLIDLPTLKRIEKGNKYNIFKPIPLTEEILLKCGYIKQEGRYFLCTDAIMQLERYIDESIYHSILAIEVKYLHQLQNLYFELTGKELKCAL